MKLKYIFLAVALIELGIGFSDAQPNIFFYLGRPVGTILFGLFLITQVMEKESAAVTEQNRGPQQVPPLQSAKPQKAAHSGAFTTAHHIGSRSAASARSHQRRRFWIRASP